MANINSKQDGNQTFSNYGISGTLGPTYGTAETRPLTVTDDGLLRTTASLSGNISGTLSEVSNIATGTLAQIGTVASISNVTAGTITQVGTILGIGGTVQVSGASAGTVVQVQTGTITTGTVTVTSGTIVGNIANAVAASGNPVTIAGVDATSSGTVRYLAVDTTGQIKLASSGTILNLAAGTLTSVSNLASGTLAQVTSISNLVSGTLLNSGTTTGVGVVSNLTNGSINILTGTVTSISNLAAGTITAITLGTVTGKDANAAAQTSNPIPMGGTDSGGTIRTVNVDSTGALKVVGASAGTTVTVDHGTINALASGTITAGTLTNLVSGTINALASGTITTGTVSVTTGTVVGAIANGGSASGNPVQIAGSDGTIRTIATDSSGQLKLASSGTILNLASGTLAAVTNLASGTLAQVTSISNLVSGTLLNSGTTTGVGVVSNLTNGSVNVLTGTITSVSNVAAGTISQIGTVLGVGGTVSVNPVGGVQINYFPGAITSHGTAISPIDQTDHYGITSGYNTLTFELDTSSAWSGTVYFTGDTNGNTIKIHGNTGTSIVTEISSSAPAGPIIFPTTGLAEVVVEGIVNTGTLKYLITQYSGISGLSINYPLPTGTNTIGNIGTVTTVSNLVSGTLLNSGTTTGVGVVSNLTNGSINLLTGTVTSVSNIVSGTLLNSGTTTGVGVVSNLTNGSVNILTGTVTSVSNVAAGTVQISKTPVQIGTAYAVFGTTGAAVWGTIIAAAGAGTKQYVSGVDISVYSGTVDVAVTNIGVGGSTGAGVLTRGQFPAGGGISKSFDPVIASGTNGTLAYWLGGAGTVVINVQYWQGV